MFNRRMVSAIFVFAICLLWAENICAMAGFPMGRRNKVEKNEAQIMEQETIQAEVNKTLKDATPEEKEKYVQAQIKNLSHRYAYQRQLAFYRLMYSGEPAKAHLAELIKSKELRTRQSGIRLVGQLKQVELLEPVFDIFANPPDKKTREYARLALFGLAYSKPQFFIEKLKSEDREVVILCMDALYANYNQVAGDLEKAFRTSDNVNIRNYSDQIIRRSVASLLEGAITGNRMFLYAFGIRRAHYTPEQIKETAERAAKLSDLTVDIAIRMIGDQNESVYQRRASLVVLGCLPQERAANAIIELIKKDVEEIDTHVYVLGWNAHPNAGKFLGELFVDPNYANLLPVIAEALVNNPSKEIDADLRKMFSDEKTPENRRAQLAQIMAARHGDGVLELILAHVANKNDEVVGQYFPALVQFNTPPAQKFLMDVMQRPNTSEPLKSAVIRHMLVQRNRVALDWLMTNYDNLSPEEKNAFMQGAVQVAQQPQEKERCLTMVMFLLPKITSQQAWQIVPSINAQLPKHEMRPAGNNKAMEEVYRKELQKVLDWWEQNKKDEKYNFATPAPEAPRQ